MWGKERGMKRADSYLSVYIHEWSSVFCLFYIPFSSIYFLPTHVLYFCFRFSYYSYFFLSHNPSLYSTLSKFLVSLFFAFKIAACLSMYLKKRIWYFPFLLHYLCAFDSQCFWEFKVSFHYFFSCLLLYISSHTNATRNFIIHVCIKM